MLTSADETDLLIPLFAGAENGVRFAAFLERLQRRTGMGHASLILADETFAAGSPLAGLARRIRAAGLRAGRVYALSELPEADGPVSCHDARVLRLPGEVAAWLTIAGDSECRAADSALLSALAPYVAGAVRQHHADARFAAQERAASAALDRAGAGWALLDGEGRVLDADPALAARCAVAGLRLRPGERLVPAAIVSAAVQGETRAYVLLDAPRIEALLLPADGPGAAVLALCRFARRADAQSHRLFAQLSGLPPREAEFAVALAGGASIAEAGQTLGLTLETARNYSKQVYAKLGLRGQAELVRRFQDSGASLA